MANKYAPLDARFWAKVDPCRTDGCMVWIGAKRQAYGVISVNGRIRPASQIAIEMQTGQPFPQGMEPDHLCLNPPCVWYAHIDVVTPRTNKLRSGSASALAARKTHCPAGHPYDLLNTYFAKNGNRHCRICMKQRYQRRAAEERLLRGEL